MNGLSYCLQLQKKPLYFKKQISRKITISLLIISFEITHFIIKTYPLTQLPLEEEHIRRAVHTTK